MDNNSLSHCKWECQYHIVFIPKYRKKVLYGKVRDDIREIIKKKSAQPTHCRLENPILSHPSIVQAEQIFTVDKSRLLKFIGHLTPEEMRRVDDAVRISLLSG